MSKNMGMVLYNLDFRPDLASAMVSPGSRLESCSCWGIMQLPRPELSGRDVALLQPELAGAAAGATSLLLGPRPQVPAAHLLPSLLQYGSEQEASLSLPRSACEGSRPC